MGGVVLAMLACADLTGVRGHPVAFSIIPVFDANGIFADNADRLRIRVQREEAGTFRTVRDTIVPIDADGNVEANLNVPLLQSPQVFRILLDAVRGQDNAVLFTGSNDVIVTNTSSASAQPVQIPVAYSGPRGARVVLTPADTVVGLNTAFAFRSTVFDAADAVVNVPVGYYLLDPADAAKLVLNRLTGAATSTGQTGDVLVLALTADSLRDTAHVVVGNIASALAITPGIGTAGVGQTLQLNAAVLDGSGNPLGGQAFAWASRAGGVASVSASGLVTGVAPGQAVIVATSGALSDSIVVAVPPSPGVAFTVTANGRSFGAPRAGDAISVEFAADMSFYPAEKLASYNARFTWDVSKLTYVDVATATPPSFPSALVNTDSVSQGILRFAQVSTGGLAGAFTLARFQFQALAAGNAAAALSITEASGPAPALNNLISSVTVANGAVTVRP